MKRPDVRGIGSTPICFDRRGWVDEQRQLQAFDYLKEENRVLREQLGERRLRLSDDQCRGLAGRVRSNCAGLVRRQLRFRYLWQVQMNRLRWRRTNCARCGWLSRMLWAGHWLRDPAYFPRHRGVA
jgi:hypothetical protein